MPNWTALNIEPDDQSDDEVDNTRDIQIEEAIKLYLSALKLHAQGPAEYENAAKAYGVLFQSVIFKYPESETEFIRIFKNPDLEFSEAAYVGGLDLLGTGDAVPSTLPQILHLAYKNHGQFILDCVKNMTKQQPMPKGALDYQSIAAVDNFGLALASDESDTELWRRAARVAASLGSRRVARYCLEAAVEVDDDPTVAEVLPQSLEEGFAGEQLKEQLQVLEDDMSMSHPIMQPFLRKKMPAFLLKNMDHYPFLPNPTKSLNCPETVVMQDSHVVITIDSRNWTMLGQRLGDNYFSPLGLSGTGIILHIPQQLQILPSIEETLPEEVTPEEDQVMQDAPILETPVIEPVEAPEATASSPKPEEETVQVITTTTTVPLVASPRQSSQGLPTRKRSQSAANIETPEEDNGMQKRSKRLKNRENTLDTPIDLASQYEEQLKAFVNADEGVFSFVGGILSKIGVDDLGTLPEVQAALTENDSKDPEEIRTNIAVRDLRDILRTWDEEQASTFINAVAADILGSSTVSANAGLAAFLDHANSGPQKLSVIPRFDEETGLDGFAAKVNQGWMPLADVVYEWACAILNTYKTSLWSEALKVTLVRIISFGDVDILPRTEQKLEQARSSGEGLQQLEEMVESLFELHIDIYSRITNPSSVVPFDIRLMTKDRLDRWAGLAAEVIQNRTCESRDELSLRYLWASVFYATMADSATREHKILLWSDLQAILREETIDSIDLHNNAVMPEISIDASERELSRLTTMDFFFNLFQADKSDPVAIIETLEPVLDPESAYQPEVAEAIDAPSPPGGPSDGSRASLREMWKFLKAGSTSLRLFLWQRLREAYSSIGYNTKVFSCHLKSIEIIVGDLRSFEYANSDPKARRHNLLTWLKALDDLLVKSLTTALNDAATCFEIIDDRHLKSTCAAIAQLSRILHAAAVFDDEVRVGITQLPMTPVYAPNGSFTIFTNKLREMQVRAWALQYTLVKEAMSQNRDIFTNPDRDLADFLGIVHYALGMRKSCKSSNKIFLKMMKVEMIRLKHIDKWEDYLGQVLYDLYGLRLGVGTYLLEEHGCPPESLDRRTVMNIAEQVITLANSMPLKDLLKHELRQTIEKMQTAVGQTKSTLQMSHNLRNYTEYLKTSIRPLDMYKAWKGQVLVDSLPVVSSETPLAEKGWYFLLGMIALTKFKSQKRLAAGSQTDELRIAAAFMRYQLQHSADHWETWYRLAQCFDYELEEEVLWSSDKINNHRPDLNRLQRSAIHCYVMALSTAMRTAEDTTETAKKLSELYHDFGMRLYASSRDPFSMEPFYVDEFEKHMSGAEGMYKKPLHDELSRYKLWQYAAKLFRESLRERPDYWYNHYMYGKCIWKLHCKEDDSLKPSPKDALKRPTMDDVLAAFVNAISTCPRPRDSRQEPILEPHHKLISIVHKFVMRGELGIQAATDLLQQQPYAINKGQTMTLSTLEEWHEFVLQSIRVIRSADKQHWQHRMISRVVSILYQDRNDDLTEEELVKGANMAKMEFKEDRSVFTKTMQIQVWKPEFERPGRHCVYVERYVRLMANMLWLTNDKPNMEALVRRVRKKSTDFFRFTQIWADCCLIYIKMIRHAAGIDLNVDDTTFKGVPSDEFAAVSARLIEWLADPASLHPAAEALREACELRKLNSNAMKPMPIDDLINDVWAVLYKQVGLSLPASEQPIPQVDGTGSPGSAAARALGPMSLNNLVMDMNGTQIPVPVTIAGAETVRPRKLGISRREILRQAELAVSRMPEIAKPNVPNSARPRASGIPSPRLILGSNSEVGVQSRSRSANASTPRDENSTPHNEGADEHDHDHDHSHQHGEEEEEEEHEHGDGDGDEEGEGGGEAEEAAEEAEEADGEEEEESVKGSVHDSADDESDLSDVPDMEMDEMEREMMFPGLHGLVGRNVREDSGSESGDEEEEGEEEEEGSG